MDKEKKKSQRRINWNRIQIRCISMMLTCMSIAAMTLAVSASSGGMDENAGVDSFNNVMKFIATWVGRIGLAVGFFGGVQTGFAFKDNDSEGKTRGLLTLGAGFVVFAISKAYDVLFLSAAG